MEKIIVVTGGAGFIGSGIVRYLNDLGKSRIVIVDNLGNGAKWKNLVGKSFETIVSIEEFFDWLKGREDEISAYFHMGACSSTTEKDADFLLKNNYHYSVKLAEIALKHESRFIYASSAATYGDGMLGFSDDHGLIDALEPLNMYGYSKQLFDLWLLKQGVIDKVVGLKYFNVYGPNEWHKGEMASAIVKLFPKVQTGDPITLFKSNHEKYKDGEQCRDFVYVKDAVRMTCAFLNLDAGGIFNIGTGKPTTWKQLATAVFQSCNLSPKLEFTPMPPQLSRQYQNYTCADVTKVKSLIGDAADCSPVEETVSDYVVNHLGIGATW